MKGTMTQLSRSLLSLDTSTIGDATISKIELSNLRLRNNSSFAAIGMLAGEVLGALWALYLDVHPMIPFLGSVAAGGVLGHTADRARTRDVYRAP